MPATKEQVKAVIEVMMAISEAIRELKQMPSGHLYAMVMGKLSFKDYTAIIKALKRAGMVREENHMLIWVDPLSEKAGAR